MAATMSLGAGAAGAAAAAAAAAGVTDVKSQPQTTSKSDGTGAAAAAGAAAAEDAEAKKRNWAYDFTRGAAGVELPPLYIIDAYVTDIWGQHDVTNAVRAAIHAHPARDLNLPRGDAFYKAVNLPIPVQAKDLLQRTPRPRQCHVTYVHTHTPPHPDPHAADVVDLQSMPSRLQAEAEEESRRQRVRAAVDAAGANVHTAVVDVDAGDLYVSGVSIPGAFTAASAAAAGAPGRDNRRLPYVDRLLLITVSCDHLPDPNTLLPFKPYIELFRPGAESPYTNKPYESAPVPANCEPVHYSTHNTRETAHSSGPTAVWDNLAFSQDTPERTCSGGKTTPDEDDGTSVMLPVKSSFRSYYTVHVLDKDSWRGRGEFDKWLCTGEVYVSDVWRALALRGGFGPVTLTALLRPHLVDHAKQKKPVAHFTFGVRFAPETVAAAAAAHKRRSSPEAIKAAAEAAAAAAPAKDAHAKTAQQQASKAQTQAIHSPAAAAAAAAAATAGAAAAAPAQSHAHATPPPPSAAAAASIDTPADAAARMAVSAARNAAPPEEAHR